MLDESYPRRFRAVCDAVARRGWRRAILLGEDLREGPYTLKACLAQAGMMVFSPGRQDCVWLADLAREAAYGEVGAAALERLGSLLSDGLEHGVDGLLVTDRTLGMLARRVLPDVALLDVTGE